MGWAALEVHIVQMVHTEGLRGWELQGCRALQALVLAVETVRVGALV